MPQTTSRAGPGFSVELDDVSFFQGMIGTLAGTLEEVVRLGDASSFVGAVGGKIGDDLASQHVAERLKGRPSLCMVTGTVSGRIAATANGYAPVEIAEAIAAGHPGCRVRVRLSPQENVKGFEFLP